MITNYLGDNMSEKRNDLLVWIDLETTGLDTDFNMLGVQKHKILEIGMHITDSQFNIIDPGFEIVIHHSKADLAEVMDDFVVNMHTKSGLLEKVENSTVSLKQAETMMKMYVESYNIESKSSPICGNNVSFDKNFLDAQMPEFSQILHYRKIDVSSIKEVVKRLRPEVADLVQKQGKHRGLDDIKESIKELKIYQENLFMAQPNVTLDSENNNKSFKLK